MYIILFYRFKTKCETQPKKSKLAKRKYEENLATNESTVKKLIPEWMRRRKEDNNRNLKDLPSPSSIGRLVNKN